MTAAQRATLRALVYEVLTAYRPEISSDYLAGMDLGSISFLWIGGLEPGQPDITIRISSAGDVRLRI